MRKNTSEVKSEIMSNSPPIVSPLYDPRELGKLFYQLGDLEGCKVEILYLLLSQAMTVSEIANRIGLSASATSQQLSKLKSNGFVDSKRGDNQTRVYNIKPDVYIKLKTGIEAVFG